MRGKTKGHGIEGVAALLLFAVFSVCVLGVLLTGARAYRGLTGRDLASYERSTCLQYLTTRIRQADLAGGVAAESFGGIPALRLTDRAGYITRVYCYNGHLMELYSAPDGSFLPQDGERLMAAEALEAGLEDGLLTLTVTHPSGESDRLYFSLRSAKEGT